MNLLRPRYTAAAIAGYFAIVGYLAWDTARRTTAPWFDPSTSLVVYQTSLVGGILLLAGLFVVAAIAPRLAVITPRGGLVGKMLARPQGGSAVSHATSEPDFHGRKTNDADWDEVEDFLDSLPDARGSGEVGIIRIQDATSLPTTEPSAPTSGAASGATLTERLSKIRSRSTVVVYPEGKDTARILLGLVGEMRPLLTAARRVGLNGREVRRLVGEPMASQEADLAQRVRLTEQVKETLEAALVERIGEDLQDILVGIHTVNSAAERARAAELLAAEAVTLLDTGNYLVAIDRVERARETIKARPGAAAHRRERAAGPSSWVALAGPAIASVGYVAAASMLLPGIEGMLVYNFRLNTTAVLTLSYGWAGLLIYALTSVYLTLRPAPS